MKKLSTYFSRLTFALLLSTGIIQAQQAESPDKIRRQKYPELAYIVDLAQAAPPELRSLTLTRVASQSSLNDQKWKRELLEQAFEDGKLAYYAMPLTAVPPAEGPLLRRSSRIEHSVYLNAGLDRLTLQSAAIRGMALLDWREGLKMLERLPLPEANTDSCSTEYVPNPSSYFDAVSVLAQSSFPTANLKERVELINLLQNITTEAKFPADVAPLLEMLSSLPSNERTILVGSVSAVLGNTASDSRAWALSLDSVSQSMNKLLNQFGPLEGTSLLRGWQTYIMNGLARSQCKELADPKFPYVKAIDNAINTLNSKIIDLGIAGITTLDTTEGQHGHLDGGLIEEHRSDSVVLEQLHKEWFHLEFGGTGRSLSELQKQTPEWQDEFSDYLNKIEAVSESDLDKSEDLFWWKAQQMALAATLPPRGTLRYVVTKRFLGLLSDASVPPERVSEWYEVMNGWIGWSTALGYSKQEALALLESSGQPLAMLVAHLNELPA